MRTIDSKRIEIELVKLIDDSLKVPDRAVTDILESVTDAPLPQAAARLIAKNNAIAERNGVYCCQDTGQALVMIKLGDEVCCRGLADAVERAVISAYASARKSVADPITRINTGNNAPAVIETELVGGDMRDKLEISFLAKGAGSENMSKLYMLTPADGKDGIVNAVVDAVRSGGANACPPLVIGVGIGGVTETACSLSKRALLRPIGIRHDRADIAELETEILQKVNDLGIGIAAFGGAHTALDAHIEVKPTHIGMLPVAVNLQCHSLRHGTLVF